MSKLGAVLHCFNESKAVQFCLNSFKQHYPDSPVLIFCEGSIDIDISCFSDVKLIMCEDTMSDTFKITNQNFLEERHFLANKRAASAVLDRLLKAINFCKTEYLISLDPDTLVRGKLNIPDGAGLLGSLVNQDISQISDLNNLLSSLGGTPLKGWGAAPAIFNVEKFNKGLSILKQKGLLDSLCKTFYAIYAHDLLIPIVFSMINETESQNPDIAECQRYSGWRSSSHSLLHQFKEFYE